RPGERKPDGDRRRVGASLGSRRAGLPSEPEPQPAARRLDPPGGRPREHVRERGDRAVPDHLLAQRPRALARGRRGDRRRHSAFAQQRMTMNLGIALGGLVAGAIARTAHPSTFTFLFLLNAFTFLVFVGILRLIHVPDRIETHEQPGRYADVLRNRTFISYVFLNVVFIGAGIAVMSELLPPFAKNTAHVSEPAIGVIWFVFSGVVALAQLPVAKLVEGHRRMRGLALMGVIWAGTFLAVMAGGAS